MAAERSWAEAFPGTDRYKVVRLLGAGGMGVIYEAIDRRVGEGVALKTLRNLSLEHAGRYFFTMELVEGVDFRSWTRPVPLLDRDGGEAEGAAGADPGEPTSTHVTSPVGGDEGAAVGAEARAWMHAREVRDPERMAAVFAPRRAPCGSA